MSDVPASDPLSRTVGDAEVVRRVFDELPLMVVALEGPDLRIVAATGAYRAYAGRSEMIGVPVRELFAEAFGRQAFEVVERTYATGEPAALREFRTRFVRPDTGETVELFVDFNVNPRYGPGGEVIGVVVDAVEATGRIRERQAGRQRPVEAEQRYGQARDVIQALQRELLPPGVPVLPQVQIAGSYLLADADTSAGGDWFDAQSLPDGRVALVVGDVVGHGTTASATMGQLRAVLSERLTATGDVRAAVAGAGRIAGRIRAARAATVCVAVLDPGSGTLTYCTAGHPPPLLVLRDGETRYLPATGTGPLGVHTAGGGEIAVGVDHLDVGDMLLLYTDGILERPGRTVAGSTVELARAAADTAARPALPGHEATAVERVCNQTLEMLVPTAGHSDDITLLAAQRVAAPPRFAVEVAADLNALIDLRDRLGAWMAGIAVAEHDVTTLQHAVNELVTNAIEHACLDSAEPAGINVTATLTPSGSLCAEVRDHGRWREPAPSPDRGLGLVMTSNLVDTLRLTHDGAGNTTATVVHELSRPVRLLTAAELASGLTPRPPVPANPFLILDQPSAASPRLRVDGPIDARTAPQLDNAVRRANGAGTRDLTVDLTGVTELASAGVAVLHRLAALSITNGGRLRLFAPSGTPADMIMTMVNLPHLTTQPDETDP